MSSHSMGTNLLGVGLFLAPQLGACEFSLVVERVAALHLLDLALVKLDLFSYCILTLLHIRLFPFL